jgi:hypothetical protein
MHGMGYAPIAHIVPTLKKVFFKYLGLDNIFKTYTIPKILHYDTFHA